MKRKWVAAMLAGVMSLSMTAYSGIQAEGLDNSSEGIVEETKNSSSKAEAEAKSTSAKTAEQTAIEDALNLANNENQEWTYSSEADAWTLTSVTAVTDPEIEEEQGVSVCVPGAYITGIDTDGDGAADVTSESVSGVVKGSLVIDYDAQVTSTNGQTYTAATAPVIVNTGAAGYSEQQNQTASSTYASEGYINVSCGNRGKQSTVTDENGNTVYTGDAPSCLVDQKNAVRFVKYNILLGNLPGSVDYFVSTGGSGGGAHATMLAATGDNPDFYEYEIAAGAVGIYKNEDGTYTTTVTIDGEEVELSDSMWGCMAYSAITSLAEADMAMALEYYMDTTYDFNTDFQKQLAEYLSQEYMEYINDKDLSVEESVVGFDLNEDGDIDDTIALTIEYDPDAYPETNGYYGTYLDLYLAEFQQSLESYLERLDYAKDWTWFDADGNALSDSEVASMTVEEKAAAFLEGRYTKDSSDSGMGGHGGGMGFPGGEMGFPGGEMGFPGGGMGGPGGGMGGPGSENGGPDGNGGPGGDGFPGGGMGGPGDGMGGPGGDGFPDDSENTDGEEFQAEETAGSEGEMPDVELTEAAEGESIGAPEGEMPDGEVTEAAEGTTAEEVGTPDAGTTQSASSAADSKNYSSFEEMLEAYEADIAEIEAGDEYGNNIVELYNPVNYIGAEGTTNPIWTRILMGASEGDISMFNSLNLEIAWLNAGTGAEIEWQWDGGHVPSEILGDSLALYVDTMYGKYVDGAVSIEKAAAESQTTNGTADEASGKDISDWVTYDSASGVSFSLADAAAYRTAGASKAIPGFDVMDYGQEDYVFGSSDSDARHWDKYLLNIFEEHADTLSALFNNTNHEA